MEDECYKDGDLQQQHRDGGGAADKDPGPQLTPLDRLFQHAVSEKSSERQMVGKFLINIFQNASKSDINLNIDEVFQAVDHVIHDKESAVRSSLVECLPHLPLIYKCHYLDYQNLKSRILNIVLIYLRDKDNQVRQNAQASLRMLLEQVFLEKKQIKNDVCNVIVELSRTPCQESQTLALTLMTKISPYIGNELTEKLFLNRFLELCSSESLFVRRVCASIMGEFCTIMSGEALYSKLLVAYSNLCQDSFWGVRKTSVDVMMSVARCVSLTIRRFLLSKLLVGHLCDQSRWVRNSAFEILGPFISTFAKQFQELVHDHKGQLLIVHEDEWGWRKLNVVPVAKVSDILTENLSDNLAESDGDVWRAQIFDGETKPRRKRTANEKSEAMLNILASQFKRDLVFYNINRTEENEKFNMFQYYYDPPDMPLDPKLVDSIINDNQKLPETEATNNQNENTYGATEHSNSNDDDDLENKNTSNNKEQQLDSNENNESTESNKQNEEDEKDKSQELLQDSNQNVDDNNTEEVEDGENGEDANQKSDTENYSNKDTQRFENEIKKAPAQENADDSSCNLNDTIDVSSTSWFWDQDISNLISNRSTHSSTSNLHNEDDEEVDDPNEIVPPVLVKHFVSMVELQSGSYEVGPDLDYHCAFSFPAVVLTLGRKNWHQLKGAYQRLACAVAWKVRSTLASSIHEIAWIIKQEYTARDLVPIYNGFIKDLDEVRIGALRGLSTFLQVLSPQDRMQYLQKLDDFLITDSNMNWRSREELARQLSNIINLYPRIEVAQYIAPLLLHLLQDRVAAVRQEALDAVTKTIAYQRDDPLARAMIQDMRDLLMRNAAERWIIRQTYALVCSKLVKNKVVNGEVFARELLPYLLKLSNDKVPNVRLVVARTLARDVIRITDFPKGDVKNEVQQKLKAMQSDSDRDVRLFASEVDVDDYF